MKILVACEFSGVLRSRLEARGHYAVSCDLLPTEIPGRHRRCDVREILEDGWHALVAFPPCTFLANSGMHWTDRQPGRLAQTALALDFVRTLMEAPIPMIAIENPRGQISSSIRKPDQEIQPYQFGHPESKRTCLWLKGLPLLRPTKVLPAPPFGLWENQTLSGNNRLGGRTAAHERSRTYTGIADAMVDQWFPWPMDDLPLPNR